MRLPAPRGPVSDWVVRVSSGDDVSQSPNIHHRVVNDGDAQLALWILYEFHYRGFEDASDSLEWSTELLTIRKLIEDRFEAELRATTEPAVSRIPDGDTGQLLLDIADASEGPGIAGFLQRQATREQMTHYLRERSVAQLKESDPQSFVLPRLLGASKVALAELQYDEFGAGRPQNLHSTLYANALAAAGLDNDYGAYVEDITTESLAAANVMSLFALNRRLRGAAMGHLAAFEATSSVPCRKIAAGIERLGFPPEVAVYFHEHVEADAVHEQLAARDICEAMVRSEPELREDVLFGALACIHLEGRVSDVLLEQWNVDLEKAS